MHQVLVGSGAILLGTWCITDAINAFPGFLAPSLGRFRGNSPEGLGASPTQSMRFQAFLHQVLVASEEILPRDLVNRQRNQCVSRLSCTKSPPIPRKFSRRTWCIANAINAFPGFLAPSPRRFRMQFSYFYTPKCTYLLYHLHLLKIFVIRAYTNVTSKLTTLDEISVIINFAKETSIKLINNIPNITAQQTTKQR